jgi:hypothetical protein
MAEPEYKIIKLPRATPGRGGKRHSDKLGRPKIHEVVDMTGKKIGSWTFLLCLTPGRGMTETRYICQCDCGHKQEMQIHNILSGESLSCKGNCGRGKQLREHGILDPGQTPGTSRRNLERWQRVLQDREESGWYERRRLA